MSLSERDSAPPRGAVRGNPVAGGATEIRQVIGHSEHSNKVGPTIGFSSAEYTLSGIPPKPFNGLG